MSSTRKVVLAAALVIAGIAEAGPGECYVRCGSEHQKCTTDCVKYVGDEYKACRKDCDRDLEKCRGAC